MRQRRDIGRRIGALALSAMALSVVASPVSASSTKPADDCTAQAPTSVAFLAPELQARAIVVAAPPLQERATRIVAQARHARELAAAAPELTARVITLEKRLATLAEEQALETVEFGVTLHEAAEVAQGHALMGLDRDLEALETGDWRYAWSTFGDEQDSGPSHPLTVAIDALVSIAQAPARAAVVVQHLAEAVAKVGPRIIRLAA